MLTCGLLHWLEFMTPPLQVVYLAYVPGALATYVSSYFLLHTHSCHVQAWINMYTCAHTQAHVHSSSRPCTSLLSDSPVQRCCPLEHQAPYTHSHTRKGAWAVWVSERASERALCWTEPYPPSQGSAPPSQDLSFLPQSRLTKAACRPEYIACPCQLGKHSVPKSIDPFQSTSRPKAPPRGTARPKPSTRPRISCWMSWVCCHGHQVAEHGPGVWCSGGSPSLGLWTPEFKAYVSALTGTGLTHLFISS